jgi:hypothetical protein
MLQDHKNLSPDEFKGRNGPWLTVESKVVLFGIGITYSIIFIFAAILIGFQDYEKNNTAQTFVRSYSALGLGCTLTLGPVSYYLLKKQFISAFALFLGLVPLFLFTWIIIGGLDS